MSGPNIKRINKDLREVSESPIDGFTIAPPSQDISTWHITFEAPKATPYYPGKYGILLTFPNDYPFKAPAINFVTPIYHPNVTNDDKGEPCIPLLRDNWKPATKIHAVLESVRNLLIEPQADNPTEARIADEFLNNRAVWEENVKKYVNKYAQGEPEFPSA